MCSKGYVEWMNAVKELSLCHKLAPHVNQFLWIFIMEEKITAYHHNHQTGKRSLSYAILSLSLPHSIGS